MTDIAAKYGSDWHPVRVSEEPKGNDMRAYARAAIERQSLPAGWKLVPVDPTDEMRDAGNVHVLNRGALFAAYRAMLAAAPQPQPTNCRHCGGPENVLCAGQCRPAQGEKQ